MTVADCQDDRHGTTGSSIDATEMAGLEATVTTVDDVARDRFPVEAPFTGNTVGELPACTPADVEAAIERARTAHAAWADRAVADRADIFLRYHDLVLDHSEELLDIVQHESGKARRHAYEEILDVAMTASHYAHRAESYLEAQSRRGALPGLTRTKVHHHPKGVVAIIAPWNYPLSLAVSDAIPALLAGNTVVLKPARQTPYTALRAVELLREAGLPRDAFQVVTGGGSELGEPLVANADYVCFTGSSETGRIVARQAGEHLADCSMELGGKNPAIVCPDADLDRAVEGLLRGCFTNAGQLCISIERLYVHEAVADEFREKFIEAVADLEIRPGYDHDVEVGSLISAEQLDTVTSHVEDARERGAEVLVGGSARPDLGPYFYEPTVLAGVDDEMIVACEETFGPAVSVYEVADIDEAIERANDSRYGLNASVWTADTERGREIARHIECGTVNVNEAYAAAWASMDAPMGGMKDSGIGRRHGPEGFYKYTEPQTISVQRGLGMTNPPGVPHWLYAAIMNRVLKVQRRIPGLR